jgi:hypothetical protein
MKRGAEETKSHLARCFGGEAGWEILRDCFVLAWPGDADAMRDAPLAGLGKSTSPSCLLVGATVGREGVLILHAH